VRGADRHKLTRRIPAIRKWAATSYSKKSATVRFSRARKAGTSRVRAKDWARPSAAPVCSPDNEKSRSSDLTRPAPGNRHHQPDCRKPAVPDPTSTTRSPVNKSSLSLSRPAVNGLRPRRWVQLDRELVYRDGIDYGLNLGPADIITSSERSYDGDRIVIGVFASISLPVPPSIAISRLRDRSHGLFPRQKFIIAPRPSVPRWRSMCAARSPAPRMHRSSRDGDAGRARAVARLSLRARFPSATRIG